MSQPIEDTIMKNIMELFEGDAVKFFGIDARVVAPARTEFSYIPIQRKTSDWIWETEDDSYLHFEFQSNHDKKDMSRFMITDAMVYFKTGKPVKTIVVYSADIKEAITTLDAGAIQYNVDAFYMSALDGDKTYEELQAKIAAGQKLTKQDLMSIIFLPMMSNNVDKATRFEQVAELSKEVSDTEEKLQVQGMIGLLAEKFISDFATLKKIKELMSVGVIFEMMRDDGKVEGKIEGKIEVAKNMLKRKTPVEVVIEDTGLDESTVIKLQNEMEAA